MSATKQAIDKLRSQSEAAPWGSLEGLRLARLAAELEIERREFDARLTEIEKDLRRINRQADRAILARRLLSGHGGEG